jgi:hypothetical protein
LWRSDAASGGGRADREHGRQPSPNRAAERAEQQTAILDDAERGPALSLIVIILIVIVVLALLGFFGRGRF